MATLQDVAVLSGVSAMTVSRVVNNKPGVSPKTVAKVEAAIRKLNYRPNLVARSLVTNRVNSIGVLFSRLENPLYAVMVSGIVQTAAEYGLDVVLGNGHDVNSLVKSANILISKKIDGLIVLPVEVNLHGVEASPDDTRHFYAELEEILAGMAPSPLPTVLLENCEIQGISGRVQVDYRGGAELAVQHLVENGHRKIGMVCHKERHSGIWHERYQGFLNAMAANHCTVQPAHLVDCSLSIGSAFEGVCRLLQQPDRPTALYCANDELAVGALHAAASCGLKVPQDLSIIGHDGSLYSETSYPRLTTVSICSFEIGVTCMEQLYQALNKTGATPVRVIKPVLIEGHSVRNIRDNR